MGVTTQPMKRQHSALSQSVERQSDAHPDDQSAKRMKLEPRDLHQRVLPSIENNETGELQTSHDEANAARVDSPQRPQVTHKQPIDPRSALSSIATPLWNVTEVTPPTRAHQCLSRYPTPQYSPQQQPQQFQLSPWRVPLSTDILAKVNAVRNLFGISPRIGTKEFEAIDMNLCMLFRSNPPIDAIVKRIDVIAIGSFNVPVRSSKCVWAILHSRPSAIEEGRCDCDTILPEHWRPSERYNCGWIEHVRGVDNGFLPRAMDGHIPSRLILGRVANGSDWMVPNVTTAKFGRETARWIFRSKF